MALVMPLPPPASANGYGDPLAESRQALQRLRLLQQAENCPVASSRVIVEPVAPACPRPKGVSKNTDCPARQVKGANLKNHDDNTCHSQDRGEATETPLFSEERQPRHDHLTHRFMKQKFSRFDRRVGDLERMFQRCFTALEELGRSGALGAGLQKLRRDAEQALERVAEMDDPEDVQDVIDTAVRLGISAHNYKEARNWLNHLRAAEAGHPVESSSFVSSQKTASRADGALGDSQLTLSSSFVSSQKTASRADGALGDSQLRKSGETVEAGAIDAKKIPVSATAAEPPAPTQAQTELAAPSIEKEVKAASKVEESRLPPKGRSERLNEGLLEEPTSSKSSQPIDPGMSLGDGDFKSSTGMPTPQEMSEDGDGGGAPPVTEKGAVDSDEEVKDVEVEDPDPLDDELANLHSAFPLQSDFGAEVKEKEERQPVTKEADGARVTEEVHAHKQEVQVPTKEAKREKLREAQAAKEAEAKAAKEAEAKAAKEEKREKLREAQAAKEAEREAQAAKEAEAKASQASKEAAKKEESSDEEIEEDFDDFEEDDGDDSTEEDSSLPMP